MKGTALHDDDDALDQRAREESEQTKETREKSASARVPRVVGGVLVKVAKRARERRLEKTTRFGTENDEEKNATTRTNVEPSRARNDEENTVLLPRHGKDGARSASERSRCARGLSRSFRSRTFWVFSPTRCAFFLTNQRSLLFELFLFARARAVVYSCVQMRSNWARSNGVDFQTGTRTYSSRTRTIFEGDTWLS